MRKPDNRKLLFAVLNGGKRYEIYTNGTIRGWRGQSIVINQFPQHEAQAVIDYKRRVEKKP